MEIEGIVLPNSITDIECAAFMNCHNLVYVKLPSNLSSIKAKTFAMCMSLRKILFPDNLVNIGEWALTSCRFSELEIPNSVKSIGDEAFACSRLKKN